MCRVREHIGNTRPQHLVAFGIDQHISVACQGSRVAGYIHNGVRRVATRRIRVRQRLNQGLSAVALVALGYRSTEDFNAKLPKSRLPAESVLTEI